MTASKSVWNVRELRNGDGKMMKFKITWKEVRTNVRHGREIIEARDSGEAEDLFWDVPDLDVAGIDYGNWEDREIVNIEVLDE